MTTVQDIYSCLCELAPVETQMDFDNAGFLVGHRDSAVERALLALDITDEVIDEALEQGATLIVSHHPVIFRKLRSVTDAGFDRRVLRLAENRLAAICMHTNLDLAKGGVNDVLLSLLGAEGTESLDADGCGRVGVLPEPIPVEAFLQRCKERLGVERLRYVSSGKDVYRLAVMGGAGGDAVEDAWRKGCDTYVTADVKYHAFQDAQSMGLTLIDADHFCTENPVIPVLAEHLAQRFPETQFAVSKRHKALIRFY